MHISQKTFHHIFTAAIVSYDTCSSRTVFFWEKYFDCTSSSSRAINQWVSLTIQSCCNAFAAFESREKNVNVWKVSIFVAPVQKHLYFEMKSTTKSSISASISKLKIRFSFYDELRLRCVICCDPSNGIFHSFNRFNKYIYFST